jgi:hypothetical protein
LPACALSFAVVLLHAGGCGGTEKGGDHVPTDKSYAVSELPLGSTSRTIVPVEYDTNVLGRFVHVAERYRLCLMTGQFTEADLTDLQSSISRRIGAINQYGIEGLINYTFANLQKFDGNKPRFSQRVALQVVWNDGGACDLVVGKSTAADFPFTSADFSGRTRALFLAGQLVAASGADNAVPVGFLLASSTADQRIQFQKLTASYLGFAESQTTASYLHPDASALTASTWNVVDSDNNLALGDDSLKIYSFAAAWYEVLKPTDLDRFHYYEDSFAPGAVAVDPLLSLSGLATPPVFQDLPGNRYLEGARKLSGPVSVCYRDDSDQGITVDMVTAWTGFFSADDAGGVHGKLKGMDADFTGSAKLATTGCQLVFAFRTESQYPFSSVKANGLYAHEGRVAGPDNVATTVPVIYVNTSNLSLSTDATLMTSARHVSSVLQHEYAHFLGFRHSSERGSLHAPAGTGSMWTEGDKAIFIEYLKHRK